MHIGWHDNDVSRISIHGILSQFFVGSTNGSILDDSGLLQFQNSVKRPMLLVYRYSQGCDIGHER
jgi:hypothetical protein